MFNKTKNNNETLVTSNMTIDALIEKYFPTRDNHRWYYSLMNNNSIVFKLIDNKTNVSRYIFDIKFDTMNDLFDKVKNVDVIELHENMYSDMDRFEWRNAFKISSNIFPKHQMEELYQYCKEHIPLGDMVNDDFKIINQNLMQNYILTNNHHSSDVRLALRSIIYDFTHCILLVYNHKDVYRFQNVKTFKDVMDMLKRPETIHAIKLKYINDMKPVRHKLCIDCLNKHATDSLCFVSESHIDGKAISCEKVRDKHIDCPRFINKNINVDLYDFKTYNEMFNHNDTTSENKSIDNTTTKYPRLVNVDGKYYSIEQLMTMKDLIVEGDVNLSHMGLTFLPPCFKEVKGDFSCSCNNLTTLKGSPQTVGGDFSCSNNKLTTLEGSPQTVSGNFYCSYNKLTSLEHCPQTVGESFYCHHNNLTTLKHCPSTVGGYFSCHNNKLTSLEHCPQTVGRYFDCSWNKLKTLEYCPQKVGRDFYCSNNAVKLERPKNVKIGGDFVNE